MNILSNRNGHNEMNIVSNNNKPRSSAATINDPCVAHTESFNESEVLARCAQLYARQNSTDSLSASTDGQVDQCGEIAWRLLDAAISRAKSAIETRRMVLLRSLG
jgi:hypothetical protein